MLVLGQAAGLDLPVSVKVGDPILEPAAEVGGLGGPLHLVLLQHQLGLPPRVLLRAHGFAGAFVQGALHTVRRLVHRGHR